MNHISEVKVSMLASSVVDCGFGSAVSMLASSVVDCGFGSASELTLYKSN